jgi:hypothetical protein
MPTVARLPFVPAPAATALRISWYRERAAVSPTSAPAGAVAVLVAVWVRMAANAAFAAFTRLSILPAIASGLLLTLIVTGVAVCVFVTVTLSPGMRSVKVLLAEVIANCVSGSSPTFSSAFAPLVVTTAPPISSISAGAANMGAAPVVVAVSCSVYLPGATWTAAAL